MTPSFELEWTGGPAEHHFRKARPGIDDLPWGTLDTSTYPRAVVEAARATWTESAYTEYKAVAAFSEVLRTMCEANAPLDLIGMTSSFVADEVVHVELTSRVAMELGGGVARPFDPEALIRKADPTLSPFERANELVLRVSCIAEAYSGRMAVHALRTTTHPLTRAVYERIVADESLHYRLGALYMEWASERFDDGERARLGRVAHETLVSLSKSWRRRDAGEGGSPKRRATLEQIHEIGWIETRLYADQVRSAVEDAILAPLATYGIAVGDGRELFAP